MTQLPADVERCETVAEAMALMESHQIRHIPVMSGTHLKGIVSQRDILAARVRFANRLSDMSVEEICQRDVLTVSPLACVNEVPEQMLDHGAGSAVVVDGGFVVGIFTLPRPTRCAICVSRSAARSDNGRNSVAACWHQAQQARWSPCGESRIA